MVGFPKCQTVVHSAQDNMAMDERESVTKIPWLIASKWATGVTDSKATPGSLVVELYASVRWSIHEGRDRSTRLTTRLHVGSSSFSFSFSQRMSQRLLVCICYIIFHFYMELPCRTARHPHFLNCAERWWNICLQGSVRFNFPAIRPSSCALLCSFFFYLLLTS